MTLTCSPTLIATWHLTPPLSIDFDLTQCDRAHDMPNRFIIAVIWCRSSQFVCYPPRFVPDFDFGLPIITEVSGFQVNSVNCKYEWNASSVVRSGAVPTVGYNSVITNMLCGSLIPCAAVQ